jgi:hypothetical protein
MKTSIHFPFLRFCALVFCLFSATVCAQSTLIDNKGNRNQSYPVITQTKPEVVSLINQVSQDNIESTIRYMQQFYRVATSPAALTVQNWLVDHFESYGYDDISIHYFTLNSQQLDAGNIVVIKQGTEFPDEYIMITSHYDHSSWDFPCGPGADDNASGTAGVLECARLLKNFPTKRSIMFVPFNAEEYWMVGSLPFAKKCANENMNIIAHLNMDMIGWFPPTNPNTIMASGYSYISKTLFEYYQQTANTYIPSIPTIRLSEGDSYGGDHMPFNMYEYPSIYIGDIEYHSQHPCYHQSCDTIGPNGGVNRLDLAKAFVQATLAAAAELTNAWLPPQNLSACSGMNKITVSWDSSGESDFYKIYKNDKLLDVTVNTYFEDYEVAVGDKYEYYVVALNCESHQEGAPSNKDEVTFVEPLPLPYSNDFSANKYGFEQSNWVLRSMGGKNALCNTTGNGSFPDNYISMAESDWFEIPANIEDISVKFKWRGTLNGIWFNSGLFFEVTNDRKTWHKLAYISGNITSWQDCGFSLNDYKNSEFFQVRFRLESSGAQGIYTKIGYIADVEIVFEPVIPIIIQPVPHITSFNFFPNPANTSVTIVTGQEQSYHIAIYDMTGRVILSQNGFNDGALNVDYLKNGSYILVVSTPQHRVAKKLVIQKT